MFNRQISQTLKLLSDEMKLELDWLTKNNKVFDKEQSNEYIERAKKFNSHCEAIGAKMLMRKI